MSVGQSVPRLEGHAKVNTYHLTLFARFVERLRSTALLPVAGRPFEL